MPPSFTFQTLSGAPGALRQNIGTHLFAVLLSLALHGLVLLFSAHSLGLRGSLPAKKDEQIVVLEVLRAEPKRLADSPKKRSSARAETASPSDAIALATQPQKTATSTAPKRQLARMDAPPAPSAAEWAFAATYTQKNSKAFRHTWGQQVRSMMGTAVEGPDQGMARFRIEIAPDGRMVKLDTLWTTSKVAEQLARKAIRAMPPLPPTPTGKPLVFEKTISFTPYASEDPPSYKDDCKPDPPAFRNPFVWDGQSEQTRAAAPVEEKMDPEALAACLRQLPKDSIDAEMARDRQAVERWGWK